jgi:hypothetical protein
LAWEPSLTLRKENYVTSNNVNAAETLSQDNSKLRMHHAVLCLVPRLYSSYKKEQSPYLMYEVGEAVFALNLGKI